jgi:phage-related protein
MREFAYMRKQAYRVLKPVEWKGSSYADLFAFPRAARHDAGYQLERVQRGEDPSDWKPMPSIGCGVREIRIHEDSGEFRVIYDATRPEAVYVLHAFQKKSQQTSRTDIALAIKRFKTISRSGWAQ